MRNRQNKTALRLAPEGGELDGSVGLRSEFSKKTGRCFSNTLFAIDGQAASNGRRTMTLSRIKPHDCATPKSFEDARQMTLECGFLLACHQTLLIALRDRRLQQKHRGALAVLIEHMNRKSGMAWPGRDRIASELGIAPETVSNALRDLRAWGYILTENRRTPETANRSLRHYTLAGLSRAELERQLSDAVDAIKKRSPKVVNSADTPANVTAHGAFQSHRPQCLSIDVCNQKSLPAVDESHRPPWTVTNKEEPIEDKKDKKVEMAVIAAARKHDDGPPGDDVKLVVLDQGGEVAAGGNSIAELLTRLGIANPTKSHRAKVADTLTKAALQWKGMDGRHPRYKTLSDWFVAEWLPGLRADLEKLADATTPRRFTIKLEDQIVIGVGDARFSLTRDGINAKLNDAEALLGGMPTVLRDFDAAKEKSRHASNLVIDIATATLRRVQGEAALRFTEVEKTDFAAILVADGFDKADVDGIVEEFAKQADLNQNRGRFFLSNFPFSAHTVLLDRTMYRRRALTYMRAGLECIAKDKEKQRILWEQGAARGRNSAPFEYNKSNGLEYPEPDSIGDFAPA